MNKKLTQNHTLEKQIPVQLSNVIIAMMNKHIEQETEIKQHTSKYLHL